MVAKTFDERVICSMLIAVAARALTVSLPGYVESSSAGSTAKPGRADFPKSPISGSLSGWEEYPSRVTKRKLQPRETVNH
jgi:hypothetical protein